MASKRPKIFNYYFLNKYLHPKSPSGFPENVVVLVNRCTGDPPNKKFLLVQEKNRVWTLPKKGVDSDNLIDGIINAFVQNIGGEMGFRGLISQEIKPRFE
ncbi:MAG: hypothetical protein U9Q67_01730 [Patescibacteria group bacterium]|nr:hypothetical protein [Patescibacteria group bacterium]